MALHQDHESDKEHGEDVHVDYDHMFTKKKQRNTDKWTVQLKNIEAELQLVDKEGKDLNKQFDENYSEQWSTWTLYMANPKHPMSSTYFKEYHVLKDKNNEILIKMKNIKEEYKILSRRWMEVKKQMLKELYGFEVAVSKYEYVHYEYVEEFQVESLSLEIACVNIVPKCSTTADIKTVFVQHQPDFNTLQSFEEQCEDYVSNEDFTMATALWTCEPCTLENVEVFKHPLMETSPGCKKEPKENIQQVNESSGIPNQKEIFSGYKGEFSVTEKAEMTKCCDKLCDKILQQSNSLGVDSRVFDPGGQLRMAMMSLLIDPG